MPGFTIKIEEYVPLAESFLFKFTNDLLPIKARYPKLNEAYKNSFAAQLLLTKTQEKSFLQLQSQKTITKSLYDEADALIIELGFILDYCSDAGLDTSLTAAINHDLHAHNIEGACDKIETLTQFIVANQEALVAEGMAATFATTLAAHKTSLATKNEQQLEKKDGRKGVTNAGNENYTLLYEYVSKISEKGKRVFKNTIKEDQYNISKVIATMRSKGKGATEVPPVEG